jgi:hypothetical protein
MNNKDYFGWRPPALAQSERLFVAQRTLVEAALAVDVHLRRHHWYGAGSVPKAARAALEIAAFNYRRLK